MPATLPDHDDYTPAHNPGEDEFQKIVDKNFSGSELREMEKNAGNAVASGDPSDPRENEEKNTSDTLQEEESRGDAGWENNTSAEARQPQTFVGLASRWKQLGGLFTLIGVFVAVIGLLVTLLSAALGLINFKETILSKLSQRTNDLIERREARILAKRFSKDMTSGCTVIKIKCRYRGFTENEIKRFNKRNAQTTGWLLEKQGRSSIPPFKQKVRLVKIDVGKLNSDEFDSSKRDTYRKHILKTVEPEKVRSTTQRDPTLRQAQKNFYKHFVETWSGKAAKGVWIRTKSFLGKRTNIKETGDTEEEKNKSRLRSVVRETVGGEVLETTIGSSIEGVTEDASEEARAQENQSAVDEVINDEKESLESAKNDIGKSMAEDEVGSATYERKWAKPVEKIRGLGGGVVNTIAGNPLAAMQSFCAVKAMVALAHTAKQSAQALQLIRFAMLFGSTADVNKAGAADGNTILLNNALMSQLQSTDSDGMTAFDSFGWNWISTGAVTEGKNEDISNYQNGGGPPGLFGAAVGSSTKSIPDTVCKIATSTEATVISVGISLIPGAGVAAKAAAKAISKTTTTILQRSITRKISKDTIKNFVQKQIEKGSVGRTVGKEAAEAGALYALFTIGVPPLISKISRAATNTIVTGDEVGRDVGNAAVSGFAASSSQIAKAQGFEPISQTTALRLDGIAAARQLKIAREEGVNQLDITSQYSFANKLATSLVPLQSKTSSIIQAPSLLGTLNNLAFSKIFSPAKASVDQSVQYKYCVDNELDAADVATDPFCNPQYGMSTEILEGENYDPETVAEYLHGAGFIDDEGNPQGDFTNFIEKCINTNSRVGDDPMCVEKRQQNYTMMRLYCIDTSIDVDMNDGEGVSCAPEVQTESSSDSGESASEEIDITTLYDDSSSISCAEGTEDLGVVDDAYHNGQKFKARLCALKDVAFTGETAIPGAEGKAVVNSRVSAALVKMMEAARADGIRPSISSAFRSHQKQTSLYNCAPGCTGGNPAARPGYSNHQAGVALDVNEPLNAWMRQNGEQYGYKWYGSDDPVHFSPEGN